MIIQLDHDPELVWRLYCQQPVAWQCPQQWGCCVRLWPCKVCMHRCCSSFDVGFRVMLLGLVLCRGLLLDLTGACNAIILYLDKCSTVAQAATCFTSLAIELGTSGTWWPPLAAMDAESFPHRARVTQSHTMSHTSSCSEVSSKSNYLLDRPFCPSAVSRPNQRRCVTGGNMASRAVNQGAMVVTTILYVARAARAACSTATASEALNSPALVPLPEEDATTVPLWHRCHGTMGCTNIMCTWGQTVTGWPPAISCAPVAPCPTYASRYDYKARPQWYTGCNSTMPWKG